MPLITCITENWDKLLHSDQTTSVPGVIKDIHDGARYKDLKKEVEIDDAVEHIELILCTDGVPLFKSSGKCTHLFHISSACIRAVSF